MTIKGFHYSEPELSDYEKLQELLAFVRGSAHLLALSTTRLSGYQDFLEDELDDNIRAQDFLDKSRDAVEQLSVLAFSLMNCEETGGDGERVELQSVLTGVQDRWQKMNRNSEVIYNVICEPDIPAFVDVFQFQQLLFTMLNKFSSQCMLPTKMILRGQQVTFKDLQLHQMGTDLPAGQYTVIDIGPEPTMNDCDDSDFVTLNEGLVSGEFGIDLPQLASWLGVMRMHGGDLLMHCGGVTSGIRLLVAQKGPETRSETARPAISGDGRTILLVDDEDMIWDVVSNMLMDMKFTVILAANGAEAIETYRANPGGIDLVIMDMVMPEMNGREAFAELKKIDPNVKVLLSSGYVMSDDAQDVMDSGALGFLRKPYRLRDLAEAIQKILG